MLLSFRFEFYTEFVIIEELFGSFYANKAVNTFFLEKTSPSPTLPSRMKTRRQVHESYYSQISSKSLGEVFLSFW
jgi:hypothetical protein